MESNGIECIEFAGAQTEAVGNHLHHLLYSGESVVAYFPDSYFHRLQSP